jgi:GntR family transcriptional regulator
MESLNIIPETFNRDKSGFSGNILSMKTRQDMTPVTGTAGQARPRVGKALFKPTERFYLNFDSPIPLYHQIEKIILDRMRTEGAVGGMLPREMDLVKIFGVSRITMKKVADNLTSKGLIRRRRSAGTQIVNLGLTEDLGQLSSFTEQMNKRGLQASTEVLGVELHVPSMKVRGKLELQEGDKTLCIRRLRGTSEVFPVVMLQSELPVSLGVDPSDDFSGSLYKLLEHKYQIRIEWAEEQISAARANPEDAKHLQIRVGDVVLLMERQRDNRLQVETGR